MLFAQMSLYLHRNQSRNGNEIEKAKYSYKLNKN